MRNPHLIVQRPGIVERKIPVGSELSADPGGRYSVLMGFRGEWLAFHRGYDLTRVHWPSGNSSTTRLAAFPEFVTAGDAGVYLGYPGRLSTLVRVTETGAWQNVTVPLPPGGGAIQVHGPVALWQVAHANGTLLQAYDLDRGVRLDVGGVLVTNPLVRQANEHWVLVGHAPVAAFRWDGSPSGVLSESILDELKYSRLDLDGDRLVYSTLARDLAAVDLVTGERKVWAQQVYDFQQADAGRFVTLG